MYHIRDLLAFYLIKIHSNILIKALKLNNLCFFLIDKLSCLKSACK